MDKLQIVPVVEMFTNVEEQQRSDNCLGATEAPGRCRLVAFVRLVLLAFSILPVIVRKSYMPALQHCCHSRKYT